MKRYKDHMAAAAFALFWAGVLYIFACAQEGSYSIYKWRESSFTFWIVMEVLILIIGMLAVMAQTPEK